MKENECKGKRIYDWFVFKGKNIDVVWGVAGELGYDGDYHHTWSQHSVNGVRHDPDPPCRWVPPSPVEERMRMQIIKKMHKHF